MLLRRLIAIAVAGGFVTTAAGAPNPYKADDHTLHLWHLDESAPPFHDSGRSPTMLWGLLNEARAEAPSMDGFLTGVSFLWKPAPAAPGQKPYGPILLARPELSLSNDDNVDPPFPVSGADGAFTMEALVKLDILPSATPGFAADIVTMDDDTAENRVFLFRIEKPGFLSFVPISGDSVRGGGFATIPTRGPHAINTTDWFHAAVTYDGRENVAGNLKLYWTRVGTGGPRANQIGRGTLTSDLRPELGDFAIGNTGKINNYGPLEFFPGTIDEVRISDIARPPHDFLFVEPGAKREAADRLSKNPQGRKSPDLRMLGVFVDRKPVAVSPAGKLEIGPGIHQLDFDFGSSADPETAPVEVKCQLEGLEEHWRPIVGGMELTAEMLDQRDQVLAVTRFAVTRTSSAWGSDALDSTLARRMEPLFVPEQTRKVRITMNSGPPDTTGCWIIDDIALTRSTRPGDNLWANGGFDEGERLDQVGGIPDGWVRGGSEPAIARLMLADAPALGLLDAEQEHAASWTCTQDLRARPETGGETFLLAWSEAYNVISGASLRASYTNVPSGKYTFRAIAMADNASARTINLSLPLVIRQPFWKHAWFVPSMVAAAIIFIGFALFLGYRRRARTRIAAIKLANAVERDRARIARDLHDDLGTRVSLMKHAASVVRHTLQTDPAEAGEQTEKLERAASELVRAMDGLVWAVNPSNDSLDNLAGHLAGVAQETFRDAPVVLRMSIPTDFPELHLSSDFRHHFALAVKESLHNILKHASPCDAWLRLSLDDNVLTAETSDNGPGFDPEQPRAGNGLMNLRTRAREIGGVCEITSSPGHGTRVVLRCPLPQGRLP
ncbi:MAG: hypothetical protein J0M04_10900 [Verrucomicrobia bacterium]|nr:hypothetical protein [Verrucomicrobiota bacterium]